MLISVDEMIYKGETMSIILRHLDHQHQQHQQHRHLSSKQATKSYPKAHIMHSHLVALIASAAFVAGQNTNLQTVFPVATATTNLAAARTLAAGEYLDGGMKQWDRYPSTCNDQSEGGDKDAVFILQDGATLSNVIIGPNNGEGIHCKGKCTLNNVYAPQILYPFL